MSIVPLDCRRTGKLKIAADKYVRSATPALVSTRWDRVEAHLKNLAVNRVSATNKLGFKGEGHTFTERSG